MGNRFSGGCNCNQPNQPQPTQASSLQQQPPLFPFSFPFQSQPPQPQPQPMQPQSVQPQPQPMQPVQPVQPMQPVRPVQPQPVQPSPFQPQPAQPSPFQPQPVQPSPFQPQPVQPSPFQPQPMQPQPISFPFPFPFFNTSPTGVTEKSGLTGTIYVISRLNDKEILIESDSGTKILPTDHARKVCLNSKLAERNRCFIQIDSHGRFFLLEEGGKTRRCLNMNDQNKTIMVVDPNGKIWFSVRPSGEREILEGIEHDGNKGKYRNCHRKKYQKRYFDREEKDRYTWTR